MNNNEYQKQVIDLLVDIRDRIEILLSDEANFIEDFQYYVVDKCIHSFDSILCKSCRFKRMCRRFYEKE